MMKLLLICLITLNLNLIATDRAVAGAGVGAGVPEVALSGEAQEEYLNKIFQAVLDIHTLAKQAKENLAPHGLELKLAADALECDHLYDRTKGKLYTQKSEDTPYMHALYTPWGRVGCFKGYYRCYMRCYSYEEGHAFTAGLIAHEFNRHLELELIGDINQPDIQSAILCLNSRVTYVFPSGITHEVKAVDGRLVPAEIVPGRTPVEWQEDWMKRLLQHSRESDRWSKARSAWLGTVLRGCLAREKALKAATSIRVVSRPEPAVPSVGKPSAVCCKLM